MIIRFVYFFFCVIRFIGRNSFPVRDPFTLLSLVITRHVHPTLFSSHGATSHKERQSYRTNSYTLLSKCFGETRTSNVWYQLFLEHTLSIWDSVACNQAKFNRNIFYEILNLILQPDTTYELGKHSWSSSPIIDEMYTMYRSRWTNKYGDVLQKNIFVLK